jgi:hypothetical protein
MRSSEVSTHFATIGCSTGVSVEITRIGFVRRSADRFRMASRRE